MPIRVTGPVTFIARRPMNLTIYHPMTGDVLRTEVLVSGQAMILEPTEIAVLFKGVWR
jgi:hypothetical protein